jgi:hypothetical protein
VRVAGAWLRCKIERSSAASVDRLDFACGDTEQDIHCSNMPITRCIHPMKKLQAIARGWEVRSRKMLIESYSFLIVLYLWCYTDFVDQ